MYSFKLTCSDAGVATSSATFVVSSGRVVPVLDGIKTISLAQRLLHQQFSQSQRQQHRQLHTFIDGYSISEALVQIVVRIGPYSSCAAATAISLAAGAASTIATKAPVMT